MSDKPAEPAAESAPDAGNYRSAEPDPLAPAIAAVDRGDLVEAKRVASELAKNASDAEVRKRAENLLSQLAPDPLVIAVMVATGLLAIVLYLVYRH